MYVYTASRATSAPRYTQTKRVAEADAHILVFHPAFVRLPLHRPVRRDPPTSVCECFDAPTSNVYLGSFTSYFYKLLECKLPAGTSPTPISSDCFRSAQQEEAGEIKKKRKGQPSFINFYLASHCANRRNSDDPPADAETRFFARLPLFIEESFYVFIPRRFVE